MDISIHRATKVEIIPNEHSTGNVKFKVTHMQAGLRDLDGEYGYVETTTELCLFYVGDKLEIKVRDSEGIECDLDYILDGGR